MMPEDYLDGCVELKCEELASCTEIMCNKLYEWARKNRGSEQSTREVEQ